MLMYINLNMNAKLFPVETLLFQSLPRHIGEARNKWSTEDTLHLVMVNKSWYKTR